MTKRSREDFEFDLVTTDHDSNSSDRFTRASARSPSRESEVRTKVLQIDCEAGEVAPPPTVMICSLPPHKQPLSFKSYEDYETHYNKFHVNRCLECRKNFPTELFLGRHIEENHDSLMEARRERGEKTYGCFVEDCERVCSTPQKRRMHLIDKHMFPKEYDFYIVNDGIDRRSSMLKSGRHRRRSSAISHLAQNEYREEGRASPSSSSYKAVEAGQSNIPRTTGSGGGESNAPARTSAMRDDDPRTPASPSLKVDDVETLTGAMSALKFVPPSVQFGRGRGKGRGGFSRS